MNRREFFFDAARWLVLAASAAVGTAGMMRGKILLHGRTCYQHESCSSCAQYAACKYRFDLEAVKETVASPTGR